MRPQVLLNFDFFSQRGHNGLSSIDIARFTTALRCPWGDENEFVTVGFTRSEYIPANDDPSVPGNIPFVAGQLKCCDGLLQLYGKINFETYPKQIVDRVTFDNGLRYGHLGLEDRVTFDNGLRYDFLDQLHGNASVFLNNVVENGESIRQDIYRYGGRLGLDAQPTRTWTMSGTYTFASIPTTTT